MIESLLFYNKQIIFLKTALINKVTLKHFLQLTKKGHIQIIFVIIKVNWTFFKHITKTFLCF